MITSPTCFRVAAGRAVAGPDGVSIASAFAAMRVPALRSSETVATRSRGAGSGFDFVSRYFAPGAGVDEDPVTGAAHCALAPYWAKKLGKTEMLAYQASVRGGVVGLRVSGDRVVLRGQAVTVVSGRLLK